MKKVRIGETKVANRTDNSEEHFMNQPSLVCSVLK